MIYKVPCPTKTNGVRLMRIGEQIAVEYQTGEPYVGGMAYDSALGSVARDVTIRRRRPDLDRIVADAKRKVYGRDALPNVGYGPHSPGVAFNFKALAGGDDMNDDNDDTDAAMAKVLEFLEPIVSPDDLEIVQALLCGAADVEEAREQQALAARELDRTNRTRQPQATDSRAAVAAQRRQMGRHGMSAADETTYAAMFPNSGRLV
jgi:hypothetical protein